MSVIPGGGELVGNLNRWRNQLGHGPLTTPQVEALPKVTFLGRATPLLEVAGSYRGPGDAAPRPGSKLLAVCLAAPQVSITAKMIGPAALVDQHRGGFEQVVQTLALSDHAHQTMQQRGDQQAPRQDNAPPPSAKQSPLAWTEPEHWQRARDRFRREVTFTIGEAECWISLLGSDGGGLRANVDRWRGQMGLGPLGAGEQPTLDTFDMLGQRAQMIEIEGGGKQAGRSMLAAFGPFGRDTVFIKLIGPAEVVDAERAAFDAFCRSLRRAP